MNIDNEFDKRIESLKGKIPEDIRDSLIECTDTLDLCFSAVKAVFGDSASPEHALQLCAIVQSRHLSIRQGTPSLLQNS